IIRRLKKSGFTFAITAATALFCSLLAALAAYWGVLQYRYMELAPPDQFSFAQSLDKTTFSQGIISNTYAAPFGLIANTWAYQVHAVEFVADLHRIGLGVDKPLTESFWFADRSSNLDYKTPGFFVCFEPLST